MEVMVGNDGVGGVRVAAMVWMRSVWWRWGEGEENGREGTHAWGFGCCGGYKTSERRKGEIMC